MDRLPFDLHPLRYTIISFGYLIGYTLDPDPPVLCERCQALEKLGLKQWVCKKCGYTEEGLVK